MTAEDWYNEGVRRYRTGDVHGALDAWNETVRRDATHVAAWTNRGNALDDLGEYEEAVASYDRALAQDATLVAAWYNRGNALRHVGEYEEAVASYDRALAQDATHVAAWTNRGIALKNVGEHEEAVASYDRALALDATDVAAWYNRGIALDDLGEHEEAVASYDRALAQDATHVAPWYNRGNALQNVGEHEEAVASYDRALALDATDADVWTNRGIALDGMGEHEEAVASYDRALALDATHVAAWNGKGGARRLLNQRRDALRCFRQAIHYDPRAYWSWYNLSILLQVNFEFTSEAHRAVLRSHAHVERLPPGERRAAVRIMPKVLQGIRKTADAPLLVHNLVLRDGLRDVFLQEPRFVREAAEQARPYLVLRDYIHTAPTTLSRRAQLEVLGLGALYCGDPFEALDWFNLLDGLADDVDDEDPFVLFHLVRAFHAYAATERANDVLAFAREDVAAPRLAAARRGEDVDVRDLYYAGHCFAFTPYGPHALPLLDDDPPLTDASDADRLVQALQCFGAAAEQGFLPAFYMRVWVLDALRERDADKWAEPFDQAVREVLWQEKKLDRQGRDGLLRGVSLGHVELPAPDAAAGPSTDRTGAARLAGDQDWAAPFHKYAYAAETWDGVALVHAWLTTQETDAETLPAEWSFVDAVAHGADRRDVPNAWEVWTLTDRAVEIIEAAIQQKEAEEIELLENQLLHHVPSTLLHPDPTDSPETVVQHVVDHVESDTHGRRTIHHVRLLRYLVLEERLPAVDAVCLSAYVLHGSASHTYDALKDKFLEGGLEHVFEKATDPLVALVAGAAGLAASTLAASAAAGLVHVIATWLRSSAPAERLTYAAFRRDYYAHLSDLRPDVRAQLGLEGNLVS